MRALEASEVLEPVVMRGLARPLRICASA